MLRIPNAVFDRYVAHLNQRGHGPLMRFRQVDRLKAEG